MRSEGDAVLESINEATRIGREAQIPVEIWHLKAAGKANWDKMDKVIAMVEDARSKGMKITADMYTYTAGSTGLDATMPPWVLDGGYEALFSRLQDPPTRKKIAEETENWERIAATMARFLAPSN